MATRAGVASVAPRRWRNGAARGPSGRGRTTGYWGARPRDLGVDRVAMRRRRRRRARGRARRPSGRLRSRRDGAPGSPSAVRWPKSASKIAARASRRPVRAVPRTRSAPDAIDDDRDADSSSRPSSRSTVGARPRAGPAAVSGTSGLPGPGDDPDAGRWTPSSRSGRRRPAGEERRQARSAAPDPRDARDLDRREPDHLGDHALPDGQLRSAHEAGPRRRRAPVAAAPSASRAGVGG